VHFDFVAEVTRDHDFSGRRAVAVLDDRDMQTVLIEYPPRRPV